MNMTTFHEAQLDSAFAALADPTRRAILARLMEGDARVTEVAKPLPMSLNAVSKHLRVLERAGLVTRRIEGRDHHLSFNGAPLDAVAEYVDFHRGFWTARLDGLEAFLADRR